MVEKISQDEFTIDLLEKSYKITCLKSIYKKYGVVLVKHFFESTIFDDILETSLFFFAQVSKKLGLDEIKKKNDGITGEWTDAQANKVWDGLIAQEVKGAVDKHKSSFSGWDIQKNSKENIRYSTLTIPLIKAVQELTEIVKSQQEEIEKLKNQ